MPPRSILILAWLLMPLAPAAGAQQPATAYDVHEALGATLREIAAAQTSFHEVHARFAESLAELSYQAPPDQSIVIAASDTTRWNAVATHRLILGVRCALVQGTPPVIRGQRVNGEPACEGKVQRLRLNFEQPVGAAASLLEQNPMRLNCASTTTRASVPFGGRVLVEFLVDNGGAIKGRRFRVIQSPSIHHTFAALATLTRCRARPAEYQGRRIESLRRLAINLTSDGGPVPAGTSSRNDMLSPPGYREPTSLVLLTRLRAISQEQSEFRQRHGRYAESYFELDRSGNDTDGATEVVIVSAQGTRWSAVAWDPEAPQLRCSVISDITPPRSNEPAKRYECRDSTSAISTEAGPPRVEGEPEVTRPPAYTHCDSQLGNRELRGHATLQFVIDQAGQPEPVLWVLDATDFSLIPHALYVISTCDYTPGLVKDQAVRVLVQQRVNFN